MPDNNFGDVLRDFKTVQLHMALVRDVNNEVIRFNR